MKRDATTQVGHTKDYNPLQIVCFLTILEIAEKNKEDCIRNSYVGGGKTAFETMKLMGYFFFLLTTLLLHFDIIYALCLVQLSITKCRFLTE